MFQFPGLPSPALFCSGGDTRALPRAGFPIRKSPDQRLVSTSPGLIAAAHVLHRLSAPRHPPCALVLLIEKNTCVAAMEFSRCARMNRPMHAGDRLKSVTGELESRLAGRSLKTQQRARRGRRCSRRTGSSDGRGHQRVQRLRSKSSGFPRKEVIQPQLPLRLPCYDFTPIIDPTFDGCLPCGLAHRLRVLPTFVV
jgi:hypothetical protein